MRPNTHFAPYRSFTVKWATLPWEEQQALDLRRRVFCREQGLFTTDDRDQTDSRAQLLVALGGYGGWHDKVIGTVRIHQQSAGIWYGSRLAVDAAFRTQGKLGPALIQLAVGSAKALGCDYFFAHVQARNEKLFQRLHWHTLATTTLHGRAHVTMAAQLQHYPPCHDPLSGFVIRAKTPRLSPYTMPDWLTAAAGAAANNQAANSATSSTKPALQEQ